MAFAATKTGESVFGNLRAIYGTYTNDDTSGEVSTGLAKVKFFQCTGATISGEKSGYPGTVELTIAAESTGGFWLALGW